MKNPENAMEYRVPYADTDQAHVVYYANYLKYFEMARAELMRSLGYTYSQMEQDGFILPVIEAHCKYRSSARFEDLLVITARVIEFSAVRIRIDCQVCRGQTVLAEGYTVHACLNMTGRPVRLPEKLTALFA